MKDLALGEICEINPRLPRAQSKNVECSFVPMDYVDEVTGTVTRSDVRLVSEVQKGYTYFAENDVLFAKITPCMENGKCAIARNLVNGLGFGSTEFHVLRAGPQTIPEWIYYYLRQASTRSRAEERMTGSAGQKRVPGSVLEEELFISLPPLPEQRRIAAVLAKADRLRRLRRYALDVSERYLLGVFVAMFGDPVINPKGWDVEELGELSDVFGGLQLSGKRNSLPLRKPYLRVANVHRDRLDLNEVKRIGLTANELKRTLLLRGDVLVVEGHGNINEVGRSSVWNGEIPECVHQNHLIKVRTLPEILDPLYLSRFINSSAGRKYFSSSSNTTSGLNTISTNIVRDLPVVYPPFSLQTEYASVQLKTTRLRAQQREALRQAEQLFDALLHKAFRGELSDSDGEAVEALAATPAGGAGEARQMRLAME